MEKKLLYLMAVTVLVAFTGVTAFADWVPGDGHKMHDPQLPDVTGWDVNATFPMVLADDWQCSETGWVKDFHFWGSWKDGVEGVILGYTFRIYTDIPADPPSIPYSRPGTLLWEYDVPFDQVITLPLSSDQWEGWYDPASGEVLANNHQTYFQYNVFLPEQLWFWQDVGVIYWLSITAHVEDAQVTYWGWKSSVDHWFDDAVWAFDGEWDWIEMYEPDPPPITNDYAIAIDPTGMFLGGGGGGAFGDGWYFYPDEDWWNIWFYDHPFSYERYKTVFLEFDVFPMSEIDPAYFEIAVNWSTDQWSLDQLPGDSSPPLPPTNEALYIGRATVFAGETFGGHYVFEYVIPEYNPEWISVDVRGYNFEIPMGIITHACLRSDPPQSLDLSFVINGEPPDEIGACCYPDPTGLADIYCVETTPDSCTTHYLGNFQGIGTVCSNMQACCLQDGTCFNADSMCCVDELGGVPQGFGTSCQPWEACCFDDNTCQMLDPLCCVDQGGTPQGAGSQCGTNQACCLPNGSCLMADSICCIDLGGTPQGTGSTCTATETCCFADGSCRMLDPLCCVDLGGTPSPLGYTHCLGDSDMDGNDDACVEPWTEHKMHYPQPPDEAGWDVKCMDPFPLADDWRCSETGMVKDIHFWGSWMHQMTGDLAGFVLRIYTDIPADPPQIPYSRPGDLLWEYVAEMGTFDMLPILGQMPEGWYDPMEQIVLPDDHIEYWLYNILLPEFAWFEQTQGTIYWLSITALVIDPMTTQWGWKSSYVHYNDDACWADAPMMPQNWFEMYEPPLFDVSMDLSFVITGEPVEPCDCLPGDANNDLAFNLLDILWIIDYVYGTPQGPAPQPYDTCSGDPNCDCLVNLLDILHLIAHIYQDPVGDPPNCSCEDWLSACGSPLRKK